MLLRHPLGVSALRHLFGGTASKVELLKKKKKKLNSVFFIIFATIYILNVFFC